MRHTCCIDAGGCNLQVCVKFMQTDKSDEVGSDPNNQPQLKEARSEHLAARRGRILSSTGVKLTNVSAIEDLRRAQEFSVQVVGRLVSTSRILKGLS